MQFQGQQRLGFYRDILLCRSIDDALVELYWQGKRPIFSFAAGPLPGELHSSRGQEPVGACPKDKARVFERGMAYTCENAVGPKRSCDFRSGKLILQLS